MTWDGILTFCLEAYSSDFGAKSLTSLMHKYHNIYKKTTKYFNLNMPHTIQLYKIPTKHSFEHLKKKNTNSKSKQHTVVITEGGTSQDMHPERQESYCLTIFVYNHLQKRKHNVTIPRFPWFLVPTFLGRCQCTKMTKTILVFNILFNRKVALPS